VATDMSTQAWSAARIGTRRPGPFPQPLAAALGIALDRVVPEPPGAVHPVVLFGAVMTGLEQRIHRDSKGAGLLHAGAGFALGLAAGIFVRSTALATSSAVAGRGLTLAATAVERSLRDEDLVQARALLPALVGRDPSALDADDVARAVVESVAENTVDAVVAPALWGAVAGAPGALGYRAANTLDSMVGHRSPRYANYGWASARLDDVLAWVPARLTAAFVVLVRPRSARSVWQAVRDQAPAHPSPNAGVAEAAFAAALGVRLGGVNQYAERCETRHALGFGRPAGVDDIGAAVRLSGDVSAALAATLAVVGLAQLVVRRRSPRKRVR
jgi:adenosylcobinamide-phosphate synthase